MRRLVLAFALAGCASVHAPAYSERCVDPAQPCAFSYDFEPSGAAPDVFGPPGSLLVVNEDAALFLWNLSPQNPWDHDHASLVGTFAPALYKVEALTSRVCDGTPVLLATSNFMPGRRGRSPERERIAALAGTLDAKPRTLEKATALVGSLAQGGDLVKVEGLALSPDCRTLYVGIRSHTAGAKERFVREIQAISLDVDWKGAREEATLGPKFTLDGEGCSGRDEGISDLSALQDGTLVALTSFEEELKPRTKPEEAPEGKLAGTLWKRTPDGKVTRLACFPGHKPEAVAPMPDEQSVRVIFEDDDYGGRPIHAYAVKVPLAK